MAEQAADADLAEFYQRLAAWEEGHKARLLAEYRRKTGQAEMPVAGPGVLEGGLAADDPALTAAFLAAATPAAVLEQAMSLEMQALDLYLRLAAHGAEEESRALFLALAAEEKAHLALLTAEFDRH